MRVFAVPFLAVTIVFAHAPGVRAQKAPEAGYIFPAGGKAGTTVEVRLGGYDWTPDMEFFVHDKRVRLIPTGAPGPILISPPPYWFGAKGRIAALPLPCEVPAKLVIPADLPPGPLYWQAANANGCTGAGVFMVGTGQEVIEDERRTGSQRLPHLPITVSGRLLKNEEVDCYEFTAPRDGPITCELMARRLGARFLAVMAVRDSKRRLVADVAGTNGMDPSFTFAAKANATYGVSLHDADFGGDRSYVYRLTITDGPRVLGTLPAAGRRGETREVEFVGIGVASGAAKLESVKRTVVFPKAGDALDYRLMTPWGTAPSFSMPLSDLPEIVAEPSDVSSRSKSSIPGAHVARLARGVGITSVLDAPQAENRHVFEWKKGQVWSLNLQARRIGSPLDVVLSVLGPEGKELAHSDDLPETTDAGLDFTVSADGTYRVVVGDMAGKSGSRAAIYRLVVQRPVSDFTLHLATQRINVLIGGNADLALKVARTGGFQGPIALTIDGLPEGIRAAPNLTIPTGKNELTIPLQAAKDAGAAASIVAVAGTAILDGKAVRRTALAPMTINRAPRSPDESRVPVLLVASTLKPVFKGRPVDQDTGRKVPRGSTFPAEVIVQRLDGFQGEIVLQMAAQQAYQVQGITGPDVIVPPGVEQTIYPCYMPEWLETIRTSRMGMIGVAKVTDPRGRVRYQVNEITGFITMTMEGALLKLSAADHDLIVPAGKPFEVHLKIARLTKLSEPARLELKLPDVLAGKLRAEPITALAGEEDAVFRLIPMAALAGPHTFTIRATALQEGKYPAISEARVTVEFLPPASKTLPVKNRPISPTKEPRTK